MTSTLPLWLAGRTQRDLADIIERRPDVITPFPPDDLDELAERLHHPQSLRDALYDMPQPCLELLETLLAFGASGMSRSALATTLDRDKQDGELDALLELCEMWALAWEVDGKVWIPGALRVLMPSPLSLGPPVSELLSPRTVDDLRARATALGLTPRNRKADILAALEATYADGDAIRAIVAKVPAPQRELLTAAAWSDPLLRAESVYYYLHRPDPEFASLVEGGLAIADWQRVVIPREVSLAVRGPSWRPTLTPHPPEIPAAPVDPNGGGVKVIDRDAAAAANTAIEQFSAVVDACGATPVTMLKTGGVGVREIRRLAKSTKMPERNVRLWLQLAYEGDLIDVDDDEIVPTPSFDEWLALPPAERLADLVETWLDLQTVPLIDSRPDGVPAPAALTPDPYGSIASELRRDIVGIAAELPEGTAIAGQGTPAAQLSDAVTWRRPVISRLLRDVSLAIEPLWTEAALLGLIGRDAVSSLGRALLAGPEQLSDIAERFAHAATAEAIFQADLTIVVPGTPTAALAGLLDAMADRESRGAAGTWRCSAGSVRRALDMGHTRDGLVDALRAIAVGGVLPQPLEYLIADMARRHGTLRVRAVGCVLRADDPALLAEIASTKSLAPLQLSTVAPTVLVSALAVDRTLAALRSAGFAPVGESAAGAPVIERRAPRRAAKRATVLPFRPDDLVDDRGGYATVRQMRGWPRPADDDEDDEFELDPAETDPQALAKLLLMPPIAPASATKRPARHLSAVAEAVTQAATEPLPDAPMTMPTLRIVQRSASRLTPDEQRILAQAIDNRREIRIDYTSTDGEQTSRNIEPTDLDGNIVVAWCYLRADERNFTLSRITRVRPLGRGAR